MTDKQKERDRCAETAGDMCLAIDLPFKRAGRILTERFINERKAAREDGWHEGYAEGASLTTEAASPDTEFAKLQRKYDALRKLHDEACLINLRELLQLRETVGHVRSLSLAWLETAHASRATRSERDVGRSEGLIVAINDLTAALQGTP